jgi:dihydrofolate reductase
MFLTGNHESPGKTYRKRTTMSRKMIAALQVSLDGFTQGTDRGAEEWVDSWADALGTIPEVDAFVQGAGMYPGYGDYWAAISQDPTAVPPFQSRVPYEREVAYARLAAKTPHYVVTTKLESVSWPPTAKLVRDIRELAHLKEQPGKNIYVVGGPTLVTSLLGAGLLDELRLIVHPLLLGGGRALFEGVKERRALTFVGAEPTSAGRVLMTYRT